MTTNSKYFETGSSPYYLNLNNTADEFSNSNDSTNPEHGFMNFINKNNIIYNDKIEITEPNIIQEYNISDE